MSDLDRYVEVYISRETTQIDTASFNIPLILGKPSTTMPTRTAVYTSLSDVAEAYGTSNKIYTIASRLFGQQLVPTQIIVGHVQTKQEIGEDGTPVEIQETYLEAIQEVIIENNDWYALVMDDHTPQNVEDMSEFIEASEKIFGTSTQDINVTSATSTTDISYLLQSKTYNRTYVIYGENADTEFPEAGILWQLQFVAGSNTWAFKAMSGITVSRQLSGTQIVNLEKKNCNYYIRVAGTNILQTSTMAGGEWIDTMVLVDWIKARMQEAIFYRFINSKKIPYTNAGVAQIETEIRNVLSQAQTNGGISTDYPITIISPNVLTVPSTQRAQRILGDFIWEARLASAVHKVIIRGTVSY